MFYNCILNQEKINKFIPKLYILSEIYNLCSHQTFCANKMYLIY